MQNTGYPGILSILYSNGMNSISRAFYLDNVACNDNLCNKNSVASNYRSFSVNKNI